MLAARLGLKPAARLVRSLPVSPVPFRSVPRSRPFTNGPRYTQFADKSGRQQQWSRFGPVRRVQYLWRNHPNKILAVGVGSGAFYVYNLEEVPITHRRRFNIYSPETEKSLAGGPQQYQALLQEFGGKILPPNHPSTELVARVVERLLPTTRGLAGDDWQVHVIDDMTQKNAFVVPGGKVFVFTGILPICQTEAGIASVLGHEIAHNVAHHAAERMSSQLPLSIASVILQLFFDLGSGASASVVSLLLELPHSRTQETEADHIGLLMMAEACYDPREAVAFWERMRKAEQYEPPQFLSTHPSSYNRSETLKQWMPQALDAYTDRGCGTMSHAIKDFTGTLGRQLPAPKRQTPPAHRHDDDDDFF
ncbi:metalloendopeptidase [Exophiala xenobiotica]|nr:metalloendopeptidase [Exophiala xenobiotica]KAK5300519.1 metalloendopeptidase [Exophiala xenobiotica]KAK5490046.1 metalloendopeptidase [Exophiala xenobiotica]